MTDLVLINSGPKYVFGILKQLVLFTAFIGLSSLAQATLITLNDTQNQTVSGQNFTFNFSGLLASDGTGGEFILHAQGDYDGRCDETLSWDIDGIVSAGPVGGFNDVACGGIPEQGGPFDFANVFQSFGNIEFQRTYTLSGTDLNAILADGALTIFVDLDANVGLFDPPNFVEVTLNYDSVPEPATLALFGLGLAGLGFARRKKS